MKKVMAMGTFDMFHKGHKYFLKKAKEKGDYLVVLIARDATVEKVKGKKPMFDENTRKDVVERSMVADKVVLGSLTDKYLVFEEEKPDIICLGYDQVNFADKLPEELAKRGLKATIIRIEAYMPDIYKSSKIKNYQCDMKSFFIEKE